MSKESQVNDQPAEGHAKAEEQEQTHSQDQQTEERVNDPEAVVRKNRELLAKQRHYKEMLEKERSERERIERERLEEQGKFQDLYEKERRAREEREKELQDRSATYAYSTVVSQIKAKAAQEGCRNPDKLVKLASDELDAVQFDDDYNVDSGSLDEFMDRMRKENDFLFRPKNNAPRDFTPGSRQSDFEERPTDIRTAPKKELSSLYAKIRKQEMSQGR